MNRRELLKTAAACAALSGLRPAAAAPGEGKRTMADAGEGFVWHDVREWGVEGKGWAETEGFYDRLPAKAKGRVREPVWNLSKHSAGMCAHFETDANALRARWTLRSASLAMTHMPATGVSGLDLYARDERGRFGWAGIGRPERAPQAEAALASGLAPGKRLYRLYLPLYNGVEKVEVGVPAGAQFTPVPPRKERPLLFYGTSIVHGGCASRPGMPHPAILGRRLNRPHINLGFSGNGQMEPEVAELLAEVDAAVYIIDCLPNMSAALVAEHADPLVRTLRKAHPDTPIVLVEDRTFCNAPFIPAQRQHHAASRAALRKAYQRLLDSGVKGLTYVPGEGLLGDDGEAAVDGSHPTDLGFVRMADALEPVLRGLL